MRCAFIQARDEIARDEAETAARIAYEVKAEFEREAEQRSAAKQALVAYLEGNEENKKLRAVAAEQQRLEDLEYMRKYEEILDKQQKERLARLEKLQEWQVRRPPCLEWSQVASMTVVALMQPVDMVELWWSGEGFKCSGWPVYTMHMGHGCHREMWGLLCVCHVDHPVNVAAVQQAALFNGCRRLSTLQKF